MSWISLKVCGPDSQPLTSVMLHSSWKKCPMYVQFFMPNKICYSESVSLCIPFLSLSPPVLVALRKADLITSEECMSEAGKDGMGVGHASDVVRIQSAHNKSHEVMVKTADILMGQGFEEESEFLSGNRCAVYSLTQSQVHWCIVECICVYCGTLQHPHPTAL